MRKFVYANDALILAYKGGDYHPFACVETVEIEMLTELLESSAPGSGAWEDWEKSGRNSWSARMGGVMVLEDDVDVLWYSWELFLLQVRDQGLNLKILWKDNEGNEKYATGFVWVPRAAVTGTSDDFARWFADFKGSGPLDLNGLLIETITTDVERIDWITTGAEPNKVQSNKLIGLLATDVYEVSREGDDKYKVITAGAPTDRQVKLNNTTGHLEFLNDFEPGDYVFAIVKKL